MRHRQPQLPCPDRPCQGRAPRPEDSAIGPSVVNLKLTRDGVCRAYNLAPDLLAALESEGVVKAEEDGTFDLADVAAALFNYGIGRARGADEKLAAVAAALN